MSLADDLELLLNLDIDKMAKKQVAQQLPSDVRDIGAEIVISGPDANQPPDNMLEVCREIYAATVSLHKFVFDSLAAICRNIEATPIDQKVDCSFCLAKVSELLEDLRKEVDAVKKKQIFRKICEQWVADPAMDSTIRGQFASGTPRIKKMTSLPDFDSDPEAYTYLMDYLGVAEDLRDKGKLLVCEGEFETEVLKINWKGFQDWVQMMEIQGHVLPPELVEKCKMKQWPEYDVGLRKLKDILAKSYT